jgi:hypothetical protein
MKKLCTTFEEWYLGDGTYPYLSKGEKVNLSFCLNADTLDHSTNEELSLIQLSQSDYTFNGKVIRDYVLEGNPLVVIDTGDFKFYVEPGKDFVPISGQYLSGKGQLKVDYYNWVENLEVLDNHPNLFYSFKIESILKVNIPEKFIRRYGKGMSYPASLSHEQYGPEDVTEIGDMEAEGNETCFYLLNLLKIDEDVPKTFIF